MWHRRLCFVIVLLMVGSLGSIVLHAAGGEPFQTAFAQPMHRDGANIVAARSRLGEPPHECQDPWEALNPFANCLIDPTHPLRDALAHALTTSLHDFAVGVIDDIISGFLQVFSWGGLALLSGTPAPYTYAHPEVVQAWNLCRLVADGALALLIMVTGFEIMLRTRVGRSYAGALEGLQTVFLAAVLANTSLPLLGLVIEASNHLCSLVGGGLTLPPIVETPAHPLEETVAHALFRLLYVGVALLVLVQLFMRLAFLDLLLGLAPLGLLCYATPRSRAWAERWTQFFLTTLCQQFVQVLALRLSSGLFAQFPAGNDPLAEIFLGIAGLVLVFRVPRLLGGLTALGPMPTVMGMAAAASGAAERAVRRADRAQSGAARTAGGAP